MLLSPFSILFTLIYWVDEFTYKLDCFIFDAFEKIDCSITTLSVECFISLLNPFSIEFDCLLLWFCFISANFSLKYCLKRAKLNSRFSLTSCMAKLNLELDWVVVSSQISISDSTISRYHFYSSSDVFTFLLICV